jgi:hypothetical protein
MEERTILKEKEDTTLVDDLIKATENGFKNFKEGKFKVQIL